MEIETKTERYGAFIYIIVCIEPVSPACLGNTGEDSRFLVCSDEKVKS